MNKQHKSSLTSILPSIRTSILVFPLIFSSMLCLLFSCANYLGNLYKELDGKTIEQQESPRYSKLDFLRNASKKKQLNEKATPNSSETLSSKNIGNLSPPIKRNYSPSKQRITANDLNDLSNEGSLWSGRGQDNFLFSPNNRKKVGDILSIGVQAKLKKEIALELLRTFPPQPVKRQGGRNVKDKDKDKKELTNNTGVAANKSEDGSISGTNGKDKLDENNDEDGRRSLWSGDEKIYDTISGVIIEEISKDHLLVEGRKEILYNNRKRIVEVKAIVARRDIADDDTVASGKTVESAVTIVR